MRETTLRGMAAGVAVLFVAGLLAGGTGCGAEKATERTDDILTVKERHEGQLLAIPGVVGVGIGERAGEQHVVVMVEERTAEHDRQVPDTLEGYPVLIEVTGPIDALSGTAWRLTEWTVSSVDPADVTITAEFDNGRVSGSGGVNSYSGPVKLSAGGGFAAGPISATEMAGPAPAMRAESAYLTLLEQAASYEVAGTTLTLYDGAGNVSLIFTRAGQ